MTNSAFTVKCTRNDGSISYSKFRTLLLIHKVHPPFLFKSPDQYPPYLLIHKLYHTHIAILTILSILNRNHKYASLVPNPLRSPHL